MIVHQVYAHIYDKTVQNVIVCQDYELANYLARCAYGNTGFAVDCLQYPCQIGDKYINGIFYSIDPQTGEPTPIQYVPTQEQQVKQLQADKAVLEKELTSTQFALTEQYEMNIALDKEVTNTQIALTKLYERMV